MTAAYVPDRGDFVWLECTSQTSSEQAGRRPALVISPGRYNRRVGLSIRILNDMGYPLFKVFIDRFFNTYFFE